MEYRKPEILLVGRAAEAIQSSLSKGGTPPDNENALLPTGGAAYEADE